MATTFDDLPATDDPVHLLGIADSKAGKSVYGAQAAIDGFRVIYIDADNGASALRFMMKDKPEARKRVSYLSTTRPMTFLTNFLRSTPVRPMFWMPDRNQLWSKMLPGVADSERVWKFAASEIPKQWLLVTDSWTSVASDALGIGSADQAAELLKGTDQGIYGEANANLTYICNLLQKVPYHVYVMAHGTKYEVYDKPAGSSGVVKQRDMILRETKEVPVSSSRPHGETMVSRFNHIGWFYVNNLGETEIDFTRKPGRVGGGPPNRKTKVQDLSFAKLCGGVPEDVTCDTWWIESTHGELKAAPVEVKK
jgi:hypothetical protein